MPKKILNQVELGNWFYQNYLLRYELTSSFLANQINVQPNRITLLIHGRGRFTPKMDALLSVFFKVPIGTFLKKQLDYDVQQIKSEFKKDMSLVIPLKKT